MAAVAVTVVVGLIQPVAADPVDRSAPQVLAPVLPSNPVGDALDAAAVGDVLGPLLTGGPLGSGRAPAHVVDVATGEVLLRQADRPTVPASTMKLVTAISVLDSLGADSVLQTRTAILDPGAKVARVVVVGSGDPSLRSTSTPTVGLSTDASPTDPDPRSTCLGRPRTCTPAARNWSAKTSAARAAGSATRASPEGVRLP